MEDQKIEEQKLQIDISKVYRDTNYSETAKQ